MKNSYSIIDFGADTQAQLNTTSIQKAIDTCSQNGGGTVVIPSGTYVTGTLQLHSNLTIDLVPGAVLKGSANMRDYKSFGYTHNEFGDVLSLFYAQNCTNISFVGTGTVDFNSEAFFDQNSAHSKQVNLDELTTEQKHQYAIAYNERPNQLMFFYHCKNITMKDVSFINAPCWGIVFSDSYQIHLHGIKIQNSLRVPNSDGIHLSGCKDVIISNCNIVSGDDCIAITSIDGWKKQSETIVITNCILCSTSAGIRVGYWQSRVRNIRISNCVLHDCTRGICIMSCGKGLVEDVCISNMSIHTTSRAGGWWGIGEPIYILGLSHEVQNQRPFETDNMVELVNVRNITFRDMDMKAVNPIVMVGNGNIEDISFYHTSYTALDHTNEQYFGDVFDLNPTKEIRHKDKKSYWGYFEGVNNLDIAEIKVRDDRLAPLDKLEIFI